MPVEQPISSEPPSRRSPPVDIDTMASPPSCPRQGQHPTLHSPVHTAPSFLRRQFLTLKYTQAEEFLAERRRSRAARELAALHAREQPQREVSADEPEEGGPSPIASPATSDMRPQGIEATLSLGAALMRRQALLTIDHEEERRSLTWRLKLGHVVEGHWVQLIILLLIFIDVVAVVAEIMLSSVAGDQLVDEATGEPVPLPPGLKLEPLDRVHAWKDALHWVSLGILFVFLLQQLLLMVAYGRGYFKRIPNVLDLAIIATAIVLETALQENDSPGLIAILLSWRIVRVLHGFITSAETTEHERRLLLHRIEYERRSHLLDLSYWMTTLRVMSYKFAARTIQRWWLEAHGLPWGKAREAALARKASRRSDDDWSSPAPSEATTVSRGTRSSGSSHPSERSPATSNASTVSRYTSGANDSNNAPSPPLALTLLHGDAVDNNAGPRDLQHSP